MDHSVNRRDFLGQFAAAGTALALGTRADAQVTRDVLGAPKAPDGQVLKAGLIGCGGRGRGAMINFLDAGPNLQLTALADLFPDRLEAARQQLKADKGIDVPANRCFTGFDAHQKLIDSGVDIVLNCTPPHFRPMHFAACVEAGKHCFLEKPVGVDAAGVRSVLATSEKASSKGLAVMTGTQLRREQPRMEVRNRVIDGAIGDILSARAFRNQGALWYRQRQAGWSDMEYMIRDWVNWTWLSGDHIVEQHIHHLDAMLWVLGTPPIKAVGMGAHLRRPTGDQYDFFSVDYEFENGVHLHSTIRQLSGCANLRDETFVGTKGTASLDKALILDRSGKVIYKHEGEPNDALVQEHADFVTSIRSGKPVNAVKPTAMATLMAILGLESAYS
jgi:myo-inositol 2-dehydrogenase/D-chiro-inositol 1-dehydrogenase